MFAATAFVSGGAASISLLKGARFGLYFKPIFGSGVSSKPHLFDDIFLKSSSGASRKSIFTGFRPFSPVMEWQDCVAKIEVDVPCKVAFDCYADREAIPQWMPFISSVKVLEDKPELSRWSLKYEAFGRDLEFSWLARNMQPIPNQKIHWRSLEGLPNKGAVRFYPKGPSSCQIEGYNSTLKRSTKRSGKVGVSISTDGFDALKPFLEGLLFRGLERFATFAKSYKTDSTRRPK